MIFDGYWIVSVILFLLLFIYTCRLLFTGNTLHGRDIALMGTMLSIALIFGLLESFLPDFLLPGMRLGLANVALLWTLYVYGFRRGLYVAILKAFLVALLRGNLFAMGGLMALTGTLLSYLGMGLFHLIFKRLSVVGVSIIGALLHVSGQMLIAYAFLGYGVLAYWPWLLVSSFVTGILIGILVAVLLRRKALLRFIERD